MTLVTFFCKDHPKNQLDSDFFTTQINDPTWSCATHVGGKINLENHLMFVLGNLLFWWICDLGFYRFITMIGLPSGKHTKNGKIHHFSSWVNPLFRLGHGFQFANCFSITRLDKPPFSYGFPMVFHGLPMKTSIFLWFSYGFPMVFPAISLHFLLWLWIETRRDYM